MTNRSTRILLLGLSAFAIGAAPPAASLGSDTSQRGTQPQTTHAHDASMAARRCPHGGHKLLVPRERYRNCPKLTRKAKSPRT